MLAIEVVFAGADPVPTFVFDEVDAGVGGKAAVEIGRRLARLARTAPGRRGHPPAAGRRVRRPARGGGEDRRRSRHRLGLRRARRRGPRARARPACWPASRTRESAAAHAEELLDLAAADRAAHARTRTQAPPEEGQRMSRRVRPRRRGSSTRAPPLHPDHARPTRASPGTTTWLTDFSRRRPYDARAAAGARLARRARRRRSENDDDRLAVAVMRERLGAQSRTHETGEHLRDINVLFSPVQTRRNVFTVMAVAVRRRAGATIADPSPRGAGRAAVPWSRPTPTGIEQGVLPARRQVLGAARVAAVTAQELAPAPQRLDHGVVLRHVRRALRRWRRRAGRAADPPAPRVASRAYADLAQWLHRGLRTGGAGDRQRRPRPLRADGARLPRRRHRPGGHLLLGVERARDDHAAHDRGARRGLYGGVTPQEAQARLDADPAHTIADAEQDPAVAAAGHRRDHGVLRRSLIFDIPEQMLVCEAMLAPPGWRPRRTTPHRARTSRARGAPGARRSTNALPAGAAVDLLPRGGARSSPADRVRAVAAARAAQRFQRTTPISGHAEGWALYAERLMDELGYFDDPADELGLARRTRRCGPCV